MTIPADRDDAPDFEVREVFVPRRDSDALLIAGGGLMTYYLPGCGPACPACGRALRAADLHGDSDGVLAADATDGGDHD